MKQDLARIGMAETAKLRVFAVQASTNSTRWCKHHEIDKGEMLLPDEPLAKICN